MRGAKKEGTEEGQKGKRGGGEKREEGSAVKPDMPASLDQNLFYEEGEKKGKRENGEKQRQTEAGCGSSKDKQSNTRFIQTQGETCRG